MPITLANRFRGQFQTVLKADENLDERTGLLV
jgi:hypothetical protein